MKITKQKIYLLTAGFILSLVGFYIGFLPEAYLGQFAPDIEFNGGILSELRGMGGHLFILGLVVLSGAFLKDLEYLAMVISAIVFGSFSLFRIAGIVIDGLPGNSIFFALGIEMILALAVLPMIYNKKFKLVSA